MSAAEAPQPERCPRLIPSDSGLVTCGHLVPCPFHDGPDSEPVVRVVYPPQEPAR